MRPENEVKGDPEMGRENYMMGTWEGELTEEQKVDGFKDGGEW